MGMTWTTQQQQVIDLRNRNILVSAAAGSGKTATLVERIIKRITEGEKPLDVDQLLVVTFTKAAAAEMRERIGDAIEKKRQQSPANRHLQRQSLLLHSAQITTIDSFCLSVIQNYFHDIDLDPVFRVADEDELKLLQHDVVMELLEEKYEQGEEAFIAFSLNYGGRHQDTRLEDYILKLFRFSESCAWPEEWLETQRREQEKTLDELPWMDWILRLTEETLEGCERITIGAIKLCEKPKGPIYYGEALKKDLELIDKLRHCGSYSQALAAFSEVKFTTLSRKSMPECEEEKKEEVKALRNQVKTSIQNLEKNFYFQEYEELEEDWQIAKIPACVLLDLTLEFRRKFAKKKEESRILDFSDVEHFALNILAERTADGVKARPAALELRAQYAEIMIDEYQDSNEVQDRILTCISKEEEGKPNLFMVGDVKQSIYRFRMAKPELFLQKYDSYTKEESLYQRIDLHQNFRSRSEVLNGINELFFWIMSKSFGKIEYDEDAALYPGAAYLDRVGEPTGNEVELILVEKGGDNADEDRLENDEETDDLPGQTEYSSKEQEAMQCAQMIQKLIREPFTVQDKDEEGNPVLRPCRYGDMVILLRSMAGWSEAFAQIFLEQGIPIATTTQSGYFAAPEIKWLLNYLRCLDNPRQDLPFTSVLTSPFAALRSEELAKLRTEGTRHQCMYECAVHYESQGSDEQIRKKLHDFFAVFEKLRLRGRMLSVTELLLEVYDLTGYDSYVLAMPDGQRRLQNLHMFSAKAAAFEKGNYRGLFQFIRYAERLNKYEIDYGEAAGNDADGNAVRIMSIHKSKGLEFPVVFLCGVSKKFNQQDARDSVVFHSEYGIGMDCIDDVKRTTGPTLKKKMLQQLMQEESLAEELRLLYVAMTRAKEKLYLVACVKEYDKEKKKWESRADFYGKKLSAATLRQAGSYLDFIGPTLGRAELLRVTVTGRQTLARSRKENEANRNEQRKEFLFPKPDQLVPEENVLEKIRAYVQFTYPFEAERFLPLKTSVSEIKKRSFAEDEFDAPVWIPEAPEEEAAGETVEETSMEENPVEGAKHTTRVPNFMKTETVVKGTDRGTLYHKVLELLPIKAGKTVEELSQELAALVAGGRITEEESSCLSRKKLASFYASGVAARMEQAANRGALYQEQPFVLAIPAGRIYDGDSKEPVLIQGIIDVFFEEEDGLVLLDYKTDYLPENPEETLLHRYTKQLLLYEEALEKITGKQVKEKILYSFYLQREVQIPKDGSESFL